MPNALSLQALSFCYQHQQQNGLRFHDYDRYRRYCTKRLRRIRHNLHFKQGSGKYLKVPLPEEKIKKEHLEYLLLLAERCWSHGLVLKSDFSASSATKAKPRIRFHALRKFTKATTYTEEAYSLCKKYATSETSSEMKMYLFWLKAFSAIEQEKWPIAMNYLKQCTHLSSSVMYHYGCQKLAKGPIVKKLDEINALKRLCTFWLQGTQCTAYELQDIELCGIDIESLIASKKISKDKTLKTFYWRDLLFEAPTHDVQNSLVTCQELHDNACKELITVSESLTKKFDASSFFDSLGRVSNHITHAQSAINLQIENSKSLVQENSWNFAIRVLDDLYKCTLIERNLVLCLSSILENKSQSAKDKFANVVRSLTFVIQDINSMIEEEDSTKSATVPKLHFFLEIIAACKAFALAVVHREMGQNLTARDLMEFVIDQRLDRLNFDPNEFSSPFLQVGMILVFFSKIILGLIDSSSLQILTGLVQDESGITELKPWIAKKIEEKLHDNFINVIIKPKTIPCKPMQFDLALSTIEAPNFDHINTSPSGSKSITTFFKSFWT